jgi:hypothetical protein
MKVDRLIPKLHSLAQEQGTHEGRIPLAGVDRVWVVFEDGVTSLGLDRPQAVQ